MSVTTELAVLSLLHSTLSFFKYTRRFASEGAALEHLVKSHQGLFVNSGLDPHPLRELAVNDRQSPEAAILYAANGYAQPRQTTHNVDTAHLAPIFGRVSLASTTSKPFDYGYYLFRPFAEGVAYARQDGAVATGTRTPNSWTAEGLARHFEMRLSALSAYRPDRSVLLANLLEILHEVAWCVPAPGAAAVSLYDHARLTASIAVALGTGTEHTAAATNEDTGRFLLAVGDMAGIQNHIYRIQGAPTGTGALAKRLRARSLEVALSAEAMARDLLRTTGLPITQRIMSAGGKFYLLLPRSEITLEALVQMRERWETFSLAQGATLVPHLAWTPFARREFSDFQVVLKRVHQGLARAKLQPLGSQLGSPYLFGRSTLRPCAAYAFLPAEAGSDVSSQARRDRAIGTRLPRVQALTFTALAEAGGEAFTFPTSAVRLGETKGETLRNTFDFTPAATPWEVRPLLGQLPTVQDALNLKGWDMAAYRAWLGGLEAV